MMSDISKLFRAFQNSVGSSFAYFMEKVQRETYVSDTLEPPYLAIVLSDPQAVDTVVRGDNGLNQYVPVHVRLLKTTDLSTPDPFIEMKKMKNANSSQKANKFLKLVSMHPIARPSQELITQETGPIFEVGCIVECSYEGASPNNGGKERGLVYNKIVGTTNLFLDLDLDIVDALSENFDFNAPTLLSEYDDKKIKKAIYIGKIQSQNGKTVSNGSLPSILLGASNSGTTVLADVVNKLNKLEDAWNAKFPQSPFSASGYRSYEGQVSVRQDWESKGDPKKAAYPGTSNHGLGIAVDIGLLYQKWAQDKVAVWESEEFKWMSRNASKYGFTHPSWARIDGSNPEPWHWEASEQYYRNK